MAKEIERKFLVNRAVWRPSGKGVFIRQGYLSLDPERTVRVRLKGDRGFLTVKGKTHGIVRTELEYEIPAAEAGQLLDELCLRPLVEKTRYVEFYEGQQWEIDIFAGDNEGLAVAEAELADELDGLALPEWAGREVSDDVRYYNSSLIHNPYKNWASCQMMIDKDMR
ncbi:CYTH domain-containing protein [Anaerovibrio sp.]|uniref:CYTH domain-containing protein n=1 Tax=Anaerovibrio sp. TaxID=1872532 RepID=UPI003F15AD2B